MGVMLKRYYSIDEAAEFLTSEHGQKITRMDVMELAARGDIRLCAWFNESLILYKEPFPKLERSDYHICTSGFAFKGYIQIPLELINLNSKKIDFYPMVIIEAITLLNNLLPMKATPPGFFARSNYVEGLDEYMPSMLTTDCDNALIPTLDLLNLKSKNRKIERSCVEKPLFTTERNSLLTIIGIMAKDGYGNDLSKPYSLAKEILKTADLLGIKITDDTIASKLKEAKAILDEKSV
ncbi:hypothetical protein [Nitrosomonas ureae]|uniref:Uncharacterized protein n=1 Tax=Nitrosomonas ureae TaxID=44577 RepID=A0A1H9EAI2_9PROT|nr:hypothetical protein [Nitrosomonas ureae]SEQ22659.1 hypothetical protein SAMN05421510_102933 [Nitrosomonas ureae]